MLINWCWNQFTEHIWRNMFSTHVCEVTVIIRVSFVDCTQMNHNMFRLYWSFLFSHDSSKMVNHIHIDHSRMMWSEPKFFLKNRNGNTLRTKRWHPMPSALMDESAQILCLEHIVNILPVLEAISNVAPVYNLLRRMHMKYRQSLSFGTLDHHHQGLN